MVKVWFSSRLVLVEERYLKLQGVIMADAEFLKKNLPPCLNNLYLQQTQGFKSTIKNRKCETNRGIKYGKA